MRYDIYIYIYVIRRIRVKKNMKKRLRYLSEMFCTAGFPKVVKIYH